MSLPGVSLVADVSLLDKVIEVCLTNFFLKEMEDKPVSNFKKLKHLVAKLRNASFKLALAFVQSDPFLKNNFGGFLIAFCCHQLVPNMVCSQAICKLGNLIQGELKLPVYKERFHLLAEHAGLDAKECSDLFFDGLLLTLELAIKICGHSESLKET